ncbi:MAG: ABC transporter permease [Gemmatimonadaceae bacterium]
MRRIARFLRLPRSVKRIRVDIDEEIGFDIDMRARDYVLRGMSAEKARARAAQEFGDLDGTRRYCEEIDMQIETEVRRSHIIEDLRSDLLIALRGMRRTPVFAAVVLLTLALGIGANTAVFSVVRRVLITPLPFRQPNELYRLYTTPSAADGDDDKLSAAELTDLAAQSHSIAGVTMFGNYAGITYSDDRSADTWQSVSIAPNFFGVLGVRPVVGRVFGAEDFVQGAPRVLIISYQVWQRVFGGDRGVIGRTVQVSGASFVIVGVLPEYFVGPTFNADVLRPLNVSAVMQSAPFARARVWRSVARLKPGVSLAQFRSELAIIEPRIQSKYPEIKHAGVFLPTPLHEAIVGGAGPVLRLVMGGALIVLLAACVNIAGLFLARAASRRREIGVRTALGAARGRLVRQVLAETLLYAIGGGGLGIVLAVVLKAGLLRLAGPMLPALGDVRIDDGVLAFALASSIACGVAFGMLPALAATRLDVRDALSDAGSRSTSHGAAASRSSRVLVSVQVAFAVVLVVGAGLLFRTFTTLVSTDLGYATTAHQGTFFLGLGARYQGPAAQGAFVGSFLQRVHALPGVTAAGYTVTNPWNGSWRTVRFHTEGKPVDGSDAPSVNIATASAEFFAAVGIPVRAGRGFNAGDRLGTPPVVVISESMARRYWPNSSPIGARVRLDWYSVDPTDSTAAREIVGVVSDVKEDAMSPGMPTVYVSAEQAQVYGNAYVVRTTGDASALLAAIKESVQALDPRVPMVSPRTLSDVLAGLVRRQNVAMVLIAMFAVLAALLAGLGVYGVMAYSVVARTREFGIRSALGASRFAILSLVLRDSLGTTLVGLAAGLVVSLGLSRLVASLLVGVSARDPVSYAVALVVLGVVAVVASAVPARTATRVQPVEALRLE